MKLALLTLAFAAGGVLAQPLPVLQFEAPKGFTGSLGRDPSAHVSMSGDAMVNVYPFRKLDGPFAEQFRRTLLRELLKPDAQEVRLAGMPEVKPVQVPGAQEALFARFVEDRYGTARYRLRLAIYAAGAVAIVDYNANGPEAYQRNFAALGGVLDSLKVGAASAAAAATPAPAPAGDAGGVDGLYLASTRRFMPTIGGAPGSGSFEIATRFYLLSKDGRFHRGYGLPAVPGGDVRNFDFARAEREDAPNTGTYAVKGGRVVLRTRGGESMEGTVAGTELSIDSLKFRKAALKK
ncbi:MAG TPA: hypothetical protein VG873_11860 [Burkholderiales bacterium]|nr:hypothetical protein [Burkholderiales bacterium]